MPPPPLHLTTDDSDAHRLPHVFTFLEVGWVSAATKGNELGTNFKFQSFENKRFKNSVHQRGEKYSSVSSLEKEVSSLWGSLGSSPQGDRQWNLRNLRHFESSESNS